MRRYGPLAVLLVVVPLLAFGPAERTAPTQWALIVGITDYIHFDDVEGGDLPGAQHDARSMRDVLVRRWGVPEENVRLLLNREATRAAIEEGIAGWLTSSARPGDQVTIYFAGHGSQVWDEDGDEDDGLDETLAPADALPDSPDNDIIDDDFGRWLGAIPTTNVVVVLDNCHAGTGTRDVTPFSRSRQLARDVNTLPQPPAAARRAISAQSGPSGFDAGGARVLELAAALPDQAAVDAYFPATGGAEAFHGGAFTTFLVRELWKAPADATYERVFRDVQEALKRNRFQQSPLLSDVAMRQSPLFWIEGRAASAADASLEIVSVTGATVELAGGATLGITAGSVFETPGGARLQVESVSQAASVARVLSGRGSVGDRARLVAHHFASEPLRLNVAGIDTESTAALAQALGDTPDVVLVEQEDAFSHLLARRRGNELRLVGADGFVRHEGLAVGRAGAATLAAKLRAEAAAKRLADMQNPAQNFRVTLRMEGDKTAFGIGEKVSFHATSERDGYLTLVDLGTDGTVVMLFPNAHQPAMKISAGQTLSFPTDDMDFELIIQPPLGRGMVRAFVTPTPLDVPLEGEYTAGDERLAAAIAEAVARAAGTVSGAVRLDSWATSSLVYDIRR